MLFNDVEAQSIQGNPLPRDAQGVYRANFTNNLSQFINLVPNINDQGDPQNIRMETKLMDEDFYEFDGEPDPFLIVQQFHTGNVQSCRIRLRRKQQEGGMIPCRIHSTIHFTVVVAGVKKKRQSTVPTFIQ